MNWLIWALLAAFFAGVTAVLAKAGVDGVNSNLATAVRTTVVLAFSWVIAFASCRPVVALSGLSSRTWVFLTLSGLATGLSWICYFRALQLGEASRVAPIDKLSVIFAIVFAGIFLKERLTWQHALGGALIVAGALVLAMGSGKPA
ncbi:EamA family transporter [Haloferula sp. BvORR071]|uniref:EamA family transporter n=1 Tax=Haloferula sp. BvORR071 TaxID=1396141 RepID=UPI00054D16D9|nr:EamA family transporter [Haloferula sp. BvORR071]